MTSTVAYLMLPHDDLKMIRETLAYAQAHIPVPEKRNRFGERVPDLRHLDRLQQLVNAIDIVRPLGQDGKADEHFSESDRADEVTRVEKEEAWAETVEAEEPIEDHLRRVWLNGYTDGYSEGFNRATYMRGKNDLR